MTLCISAVSIFAVCLAKVQLYSTKNSWFPPWDEFRHGSRCVPVIKWHHVTARWCLNTHTVPTKRPALPRVLHVHPRPVHLCSVSLQLKSSWPTRDTLCPTPAAPWRGETWLASCSPCSAATPGSRRAWPWPPNNNQIKSNQTAATHSAPAGQKSPYSSKQGEFNSSELS